MSLLSPSSIAVIGASAQEGKVGHDILQNLLTQGFTGDVYPVNPKAGEILGKTACKTIGEISGDVDMAVIVIPAPLVAAALKECGEKKVKTVVVISAGFGETHTDEGKQMEEELREIAKHYGITLIGPNCLGILRPSIGMNASFAKNMPPTGGIAFVSQSGATAVGLMDGAAEHGLGFSSVISIGNKAMWDETDALMLLADDPQTTVIAFYLESIRNGRKLLEVARNVAQKKPIVLLKAGTSEAGKRAASSHTGALAGTDSGIDALCAQTGILRAHTSGEFLDLLSTLSQGPRLLSDRIAIITNAGGPGILATDAAAAVGARHAVPLQLPALSPNIEAQLRTKLPASASTANPIDLIGDAGADRYEAALLACREDPNIDGLCVLLTPQVMTPCNAIAEIIVRVMKSAPLMPVTTCFMGDESVEEARAILRKNRIPTFETPERAVRALGALSVMVRGSLRLAPHHDGPVTLRSPKVHHNIPSGLLSEQATAALCAAYDLPLPGQSLTHSEEEAVKAAEQIGYPVVAKISSPQIVHKTDVGGVFTHLLTEEDVRKAYREILQNAKAKAPQATVNGVLIQKQLPAGDEFIVGIVNDPSFGPLIMAGLGGIYTELFHDVSFRIAPIDQNEAYRMLEELQSWKLLLGLRGKKQSDIDALAELIAKTSQMAAAEPRISELDFNPVLVNENGTVIVDAKVMIG